MCGKVTGRASWEESGREQDKERRKGLLGQAWCEESESDVMTWGGVPRPAGQEQHGAHFTKAKFEAGRPARQEHLLVQQAKNRAELKRGPGE